VSAWRAPSSKVRYTSWMIYGLLADLVVLVHGAFVGFVVLGGLLVLGWRRAAWLHVPAVSWGAGIEISGGVCPLTPLENWLRLRAGANAYAGGFVERYVVPALYPATLTRRLQIGLGFFVIALNGAVYWWVLRQHRRRRYPGS